MTWITPDSSNLVAASDCGETTTYIIENMLDATGVWIHLVSEVHYFELDLGSSLDITRFNFKGNTSGGGSGFAPTDMDVFVSTDGSTWGTAVLTGVDTSSYTGGTYGDFVSTRKTGRYIRFEINATSGGTPGILAWGVSGQSMIQVWDGDIPKKYTTTISMAGKYNNNFSNTYTPTDGRNGMIPWDGSKYNNIISAKAIATGRRTGISGNDPVPAWAMECYDRTNSQQIALAAGYGTAYESAISSADGSANLPTGAAVFDVRYLKKDAVSSQHMNFDLQITQESEATGNKTCVYIPMGSYHAKMGATSGFHPNPYRWGEYPTGHPSEHQFKYVAADWDCTIDKVYFTTTLRSASTNTVTCELNDVAYTGASLATHTHATTTYTEESSADIKGSLVDGTTYGAFLKSTVANQAGDICSDAYLVFEISDMNSFPTFQDVGIIGKYMTSTTSWTEATDQLVKYCDNDTELFSSDVTRVDKHVGVAGRTSSFGGTSASVSVYDDGTRNSTADFTTVAVGGTWSESAALTIADESVMALGHAYVHSGFGGGGCAYDSMLVKYISDLDLAPVVGGATTPIRMMMGVGT